MNYTATLFPPKWNNNERKELVNFWVDRYSTNDIHMSPVDEISSGGDKLISSKLLNEELIRKANDENDVKLQEDLKRHHRDPAHPVNINFNHEMLKLKQEQNNCTGPDIERLNLLINASQECHDNWNIEQDVNRKKEELQSQNINPKKDKEYNVLENNLENSNISLGTSMSSLINYDKLYDHPISYQDRNLKENPPSMQERKSWCERSNNAEFGQERSFINQNEESKKFQEIRSKTTFEEFNGHKEYNSNRHQDNLKTAIPSKMNERVNNIIKDSEEKNIYRTANGENTRNKEDSRISRPSTYIFEEFNDRNKQVKVVESSGKEQLSDFNQGNILKYAEKDKNKIPTSEETREKNLYRDNYENEKSKINKDYNKKVLEIGTAEADYKKQKEENRIKKLYGPKNESEEKRFNELRKEQREESKKEQEKERSSLSKKENRWDKMLNKTKEWTNNAVSKIKECGDKIKDKYHDLTHGNNKEDKNHNLKKSKTIEQKREVFKENSMVKRPSLNNSIQRNNPNTIKNENELNSKRPSLSDDKRKEEMKNDNKGLSTRPSLNVKRQDNLQSENNITPVEKPKMSDNHFEKPNIPSGTNHNIKL